MHSVWRGVLLPCECKDHEHDDQLLAIAVLKYNGCCISLCLNMLIKDDTALFGHPENVFMRESEGLEKQKVRSD